MSKQNPTWISEWKPEDETFWNSTGKVVARRNLIWSIVAAYRIFGLADLEHRRNQVAAGRLSLHDRPAVSAGGAARIDRLPDAVSLHVCGNDVRRPQLDHLQCVGAVHPDARARVFRNPARYPVLADAAGGRHGRSWRRQLRLEYGQYLLLLSGSHEGLGAWLERGWREHRRQQRPIADANSDGCLPDQPLPVNADLQPYLSS